MEQVTGTGARGGDGQPPAAPVRVTHLGAARDLRRELARDVLEGLTAAPKQLPPKWFYDARGSQLFEEITRLPEYYQTRTETRILQRHARDIVAATRPAELVEIGSGSSRKTRLLLEAMHAAASGDRYVPLDVSEDALTAAATALVADYPWLRVHAMVGDFGRDLKRLPAGPSPRLVAFLGSTVGNLEPAAQVGFLRDVAGLLDQRGALLLGVDLVKDPATLKAAYDDAAGVTAAFNRNVLQVINRELGADFPVGAFTHVARYMVTHQRIEMWLVATRALTVRFPTLNLTVPFAHGEGVRTEISCKFNRQTVIERLQAAGLMLHRWFTDPEQRFALALATRTGVTTASLPE